MTRKRTGRSGFEQRLLANLRDCQVASGDRLVVGFSGGADSLALAAALERVAPVLDLSLHLVHVDHGLRPESKMDAERAMHLASALGLSIEVVRLPPGLRDRARGLGVEEQARRERYSALGAAARASSADTILLAHQANDQAETVLLHLFRGAGLRGISGMALVEARPIPWWDGCDGTSDAFRIVRPLLGETKASVERYVSDIGLEPIQDPSNESNDHDRNWIRHRVIPAVTERWPGAVETLARSAAAFRIDEIFLASLGEELLTQARTHDRTLCTDTIRRVDIALAYRLIRDWLAQIGVEDVGFDVVERCYDLVARNDCGAVIEAGSGVRVVQLDGGLTTLSKAIDEAAMTLPIETECDPPLWQISVHADLLGADCVINLSENLDVDVRSVRPGDKWLGSSRPVNDDLRTGGISPHLRNRLLCLATDDGVLLIPAIYPTIRSVVAEEDSAKVGIRWRRRA